MNILEIEDSYESAYAELQETNRNHKVEYIKTLLSNFEYTDKLTVNDCIEIYKILRNIALRTKLKMEYIGSEENIPIFIGINPSETALKF